jgi:hypothetical protein
MFTIFMPEVQNHHECEEEQNMQIKIDLHMWSSSEISIDLNHQTLKAVNCTQVLH